MRRVARVRVRHAGGRGRGGLLLHEEGLGVYIDGLGVHHPSPSGGGGGRGGGGGGHGGPVPAHGARARSVVVVIVGGGGVGVSLVQIFQALVQVVLGIKEEIVNLNCMMTLHQVNFLSLVVVGSYISSAVCVSRT